MYKRQLELVDNLLGSRAHVGHLFGRGKVRDGQEALLSVRRDFFGRERAAGGRGGPPIVRWPTLHGHPTGEARSDAQLAEMLMITRLNASITTTRCMVKMLTTNDFDARVRDDVVTLRSRFKILFERLRDENRERDRRVYVTLNWFRVHGDFTPGHGFVWACT